MKHNMNLNNEPYNSIYYGNKDIELRLNDEKRRLINIGDIITFTNRDTLDTFDVEVVNLHKYNSFKELYDKFDKVRLGYKESEGAKAEDMEKYYLKEDIEKYGVVGIEMKKIDPYKNIKGINKLKEVFGDIPTYHDAEIVKLSYIDREVVIKISTKYYLYKKHDDSIDDVYVKYIFKNVSNFELDYDEGMNIIDRLDISRNNNLYEVKIDSYYMSLTCEDIEIEVQIINKSNNNIMDVLKKL